MRDPYLYADVDVMKNKLGIKDNDKLEAAEKGITPIKLLDVDKYIGGRFDFEKLQQIHKHIFEDIYEWAGDPRKINIEKSEKILSGLSVNYCDFKSVEKEAKKVIDEINKVNWKNLNTNEKAEVFAKLTAELWKVHSFREGNTRTTITFMELFAKSKGINIDRELLKNNGSYVRNSLVLASIGEYSEYEHLTKIIKNSITEEKKEHEITATDNKINILSNNVVEQMLEKDEKALKVYKENKAKGNFNINNAEKNINFEVSR